MEIREIWRSNLEQELNLFNVLLKTFPRVGIDTEFPGFLRNSRRDSSQTQKYEDLKYNVDRLTPIQLGLTLFDRNGIIGGVWQINFCNFDCEVDMHVSASIELLKKNGINFDKNKREGVDISVFAQRFRKILATNEGLEWVTFHGLYDLGYMIKIVTHKPLPNSITVFLRLIAHFFGYVYDVKFMARFCQGLLGGELGLARLANMLEVERFGVCHQAGSDSLLTATVFLKMKEVYGFDEKMQEGFLYGIGDKVERTSRLIFTSLPQRYYGPIVVRCVPCYFVRTRSHQIHLSL